MGINSTGYLFGCIQISRRKSKITFPKVLRLDEGVEFKTEIKK